MGASAPRPMRYSNLTECSAIVDPKTKVKMIVVDGKTS